MHPQYLEEWPNSAWWGWYQPKEVNQKPKSPQIDKKDLSDYKIVAAAILPARQYGDILDFEYVFKSPGKSTVIYGFVTVEGDGSMFPRSIATDNARITESARKKLRRTMSRISQRLMKEMLRGEKSARS